MRAMVWAWAVAVACQTAACQAVAAPKAAQPAVPAGMETAAFAGGCFWCMEADFEHLGDERPGAILSVTSGYQGGSEKDPSYEQVSSHGTTHAEGVLVVFDPKKISYAELVAFFFRHVDPTQGDGQFCDIGKQYRTFVFAKDKGQQQIAEQQRDAAQKALGQKIVTDIVINTTFWPAEEYHQDYYKKNTARYQMYRTGCGRDDRVRELWGKPAPATVPATPVEAPIKK